MTLADIKELLGLEDNCTAQINNIGNNCFRVNIFKVIKEEGHVVSRNTIAKSYFIRYINGMYVNETR